MNVFKNFILRNTPVENTPIFQTPALNYAEVIDALERTTYGSILIIDFQTSRFEYISDSPIFLDGHSAAEIREIGCEIYDKYVLKADLNLLLKVNALAFEYYDNLPVDERKNQTISYDFHIKNHSGTLLLLNQKLTPLLLTASGKIWKAICTVSLSAEREAGNFQVYKKGSNRVLKYNLEGNFWKTDEKIKLTTREKEILQLSLSGYSISEIAAAAFISPDTVKFHRKTLFNKLEVNNITAAIISANNNRLI
ncbi:response regulator transcription factor [Flavobacterium sp. JP2137]|uniref:response regulator transcription factor n=1 Tax=Flavobacterium sp. JP2137 TaxID=3414510 RepID=UPI003D2FCCEF